FSPENKVSIHYKAGSRRFTACHVDDLWPSAYYWDRPAESGHFQDRISTYFCPYFPSISYKYLPLNSVDLWQSRRCWHFNLNSHGGNRPPVSTPFDPIRPQMTPC